MSDTNLTGFTNLAIKRAVNDAMHEGSVSNTKDDVRDIIEHVQALMAVDDQLQAAAAGTRPAPQPQPQPQAQAQDQQADTLATS